MANADWRNQQDRGRNRAHAAHGTCLDDFDQASDAFVQMVIIGVINQAQIIGAQHHDHQIQRTMAQKAGQEIWLAIFVSLAGNAVNGRTPRKPFLNHPVFRAQFIAQYAWPAGMLIIAEGGLYGWPVAGDAAPCVGVPKAKDGLHRLLFLSQSPPFPGWKRRAHMHRMSPCYGRMMEASSIISCRASSGVMLWS